MWLMLTSNRKRPSLRHVITLYFSSWLDSGRKGLKCHRRDVPLKQFWQYRYIHMFSGGSQPNFHNF